MRWRALLVIGYGGLAIASTYPLCTRLEEALPLGTEVVPTVPYVSAWALWWTADRLGHGFERYATEPDVAALESAGVSVLIVQRDFTSGSRAVPRWPLVHVDERWGLEIYRRNDAMRRAASESHGLTP